MSAASTVARDPAGEASCAHCGLPVPQDLLDETRDNQFCCSGCRTVYQAIHEFGLQRFYDLQETEDAGIPGRPSGSGYEYLDHPAFRDAHATASTTGHPVVELYLEGLHCAACVWMIEKLPQVQPGVIEARVEFGRRVVRVTWDEDAVRLSSIARALDSLGYACHPYRASKLEESRRRENRSHLIRIAASGAIAGNVMLISFALFGGMFDEMEARFDALFRWSSLGLTVLALFWPGRVFLIGALSSIRTRTMHMDVPVALALTAGAVSGAVNTVRGTGETYFESLTAIIFLLLVGRFVLYRQQRAAQDSVELLFSLTPRTARLLEGTTVREVPVEALGTGDRIELRAGDSVPADGTIVEDASDFDFSLLTGESMPVARGEGDRVYAGTHNLSRRVVLDVDSTGARTRVGRLMALVESFSRDRPPVVRLADRIAHYFVFVVLAVAGLTAGFWAWMDSSVAVENAIAVLIVTCPCALGLATPLALVAAIGQAARRGILVKGGEVLESLSSRGLLLLDKTGTLTHGDLRLQYWKGDDSIRPLVAAVEAGVAHPIARAFVEAIRPEGGAVSDVRVTHVSGSGVGGRVSGRTIVVGSPEFVRGEAETAPGWVEASERECAEQALSPVLVALDGTIVAVAGFGDTPREDAPESVATLRDMGWSLGVLSGDDPRLARTIARRIGLDPSMTEGGVAPERKAEIVRDRLHNGGPVVMVGDGVNDTAALAAATVGIAVHGGAEASLSAADVFLGKPGLHPLVELMRGSRRTVGVIRRNILISLIYNLVAGTLAVAGMIDPLIAAILMPVSSLTVVTSSYRSRTFED